MCRAPDGCWTFSQMFDADELRKLVHEFAEAMVKKLHQQVVDGYAGWDDPEVWGDVPIEKIKARLIQHIEKGDPVDVANFAAFWWYHERGEAP